jgi:uroporphyrinogen decarboxylase
MNSRQRVLSTFAFEQTDRPPFDLMEGCVWKELLEYFQAEHGLQDAGEVIEFLDPDFRWTFLSYLGPVPDATDSREGEQKTTQSKEVASGPLSRAESIAEIEAYPWFDPALLGPADYATARRRWPDQAIVFCPGWMPLFWTACELFGVEAAMLNMTTRPDLFEALIKRQHALTMDILRRAAPAARGNCDLAWLGDDFAHQQNMMVSPALWRRFIKPYLAEQVQVMRENGMKVLFHSCGSVRPVLPDLIEIGVNALLVFQTTARGMDAGSIARDFGGKLAFYGGIDVQHLLSFGTPEQVKDTVQANCRAFADCGGYIVANSHHTIPSIRGENIFAMCQAAKSIHSQAPS